MQVSVVVIIIIIVILFLLLIISYLFDVSCWQLIRQCLNTLTPHNFNLILLSQKFAHDSSCRQQEYWYKTNYGVEGRLVIMN